MAALPDFQVKEKEFYELCNLPPTANHPHPELLGFKIIMVSKMSPVGDGQTFVCKWPSMESLTYFFKEDLRVLPTFDLECTMTERDVLLLLLRHIDPLDLCFVYGRLHSSWLDNQRVETLNAAMNFIGVDHMQEVEMTHIRPNQLYVIDNRAFPQGLRDQLVGFSRIAWVSGVTEEPNELRPAVEVRVPTPESLDAFLSSESLLMPDFNRVSTISRVTARVLLKWVMPLDMCFRLRKRPDFWIIN